MTKAPKRQSTASAVAVLHCAAGEWRGVIAATSDDRPTILAWRRFETDQNELIDQWLDKHQVGRVIGVLPAAAVICRTCPLPDGEGGMGQVYRAIDTKLDHQWFGSRGRFA